MDVDEHVVPAGGRIDQVADLADRLDLVELPVGEPDRRQREPVGRISRARATVIFGARSVPYQGVARAPFIGLRVVATRSNHSCSETGLCAAAYREPGSTCSGFVCRPWLGLTSAGSSGDT